MEKLAEAPKDCIRTHSGLYINIFDPKPEMIEINDIAHALANVPRWAGHLKRHYSVAQHSILCAEMASDENKLAALLHDATEAFMQDIPTPIKAKLPEYKLYEDVLMKAIAEKFGIQYPFDPEIKVIDNHMLNIEWEMLVIYNDPKFKCMTAAQAKREFIKMYEKITK
jgi:hypothetical protein